jgi:hypothetical protein
MAREHDGEIESSCPKRMGVICTFAVDILV